MSDFLILFAIAAIAGVAVTLQSSFMGTMTQVLGTRESIFITYGSGGLLIGLIMLFARGGNMAAWRQVPFYTFSAGLLGLVIVGSIGYATARYGLIATFGVLLLAQYGLAAVIDHYGLFGATIQPLDPLRVLGIVLLLVGAWLVLR